MVVAGEQVRLRVDVLGPLRLEVDGTTVDVPGAKRRAVLAMLALAEGRTVTVDRLLDALFPAELPDSGRAALHSHVFRLRNHLGKAGVRLETRPSGYRLALGPDDLDLADARRLLATARTTSRQDSAGALGLLRRAHGLWRGPVLADLTEFGPVAAAVEEIAHLRREVTDALIGCAVEAGEADQVLGLAHASLAADPLREPAVLLLMRALGASGHASEALRVSRDYRDRLAEETGLDPSPALGDLERDIAGGAVGPPPRRTQVPRGATTRLIGREERVAALHRQLAADRLVTLVGPGGVGKTRVALEVASGSDDATVLMLAPVGDPAAIPHALARALDLEVAQGDVLSACLAVLGDRPGLLVVDNCEHLLDGVRETVGQILWSCPRLSILATSREPLGLAAEHTSRLPPLSLPGPGQNPRGAASVAVFLDRMSRVRPGRPPTSDELATVVDIVRRLDGMPLAIELAASRLSAFSLPDLRDRLDRSLDLLGGGLPDGDPRHRTLRATIDWSYQLLDEDAQRLFRHLSVFVDGLDLDTVERVAADLGLGCDPGTALARLVDASMVEPRFEGRTRYRMLETLRTFGVDRLVAAGEDEAAVGRLIHWAVELCRSLGSTMATAHEPQADATLRRELPNLRTAWRHARERRLLDAAVQIVTSLFEPLAYRDLTEIRAWAEELADDPSITGHPRAAEVLGTAAEAAYHRGDYRKAERLARTGLERAEDERGRWYCLMPLSVAALARGAYAEVVDHALASVEVSGQARESLGIAALATLYAGDLDEARRLNDRGTAEAVSPTMRSWCAYVAGEIESVAGRRELAEQHYLHAIELGRTSGATFLVGVATVGLLALRGTTGGSAEVLRGYREVIDYFARTGNWTHEWVTLRNLADLLRRLGDVADAVVIDAAADRASDAPAVGDASRRPARLPSPTASAAPALSQAGVLEVARRAIEANLTGS